MGRYHRLEVKNGNNPPQDAVINIDDISRIMYHPYENEATITFKDGSKLKVFRAEAQRIERELLK